MEMVFFFFLLMMMMEIDGLALNGNAPKIFTRVNRWGLPYVAVVTNCLFGLLAYMAVSSGAGRVFGWSVPPIPLPTLVLLTLRSLLPSFFWVCRFANMTSIAGLMSWFGISVTYVRFYAGMKAQGFDRSTLPYKSRFQPYLGWYGVFSTIIVCFVRPFPPSSPSPLL